MSKEDGKAIAIAIVGRSIAIEIVLLRKTKTNTGMIPILR